MHKVIIVANVDPKTWKALLFLKENDMVIDMGVRIVDKGTLPNTLIASGKECDDYIFYKPNLKHCCVFKASNLDEETIKAMKSISKSNDS